jgi:preprotein translocase subunit SecD
MIFYYHSGGAVADFALLFNMLFIIGVMAGFQATLTLPGIAGMVLTIGMAVDANVLINERIREELTGGKTLRAAIDAGYDKAFSAILDSNVTTFITGIILYQFGTGPIQGFALTLMIGIVATMFSAIIITHVIFNIMTEKGIIPNFG